MRVAAEVTKHNPKNSKTQLLMLRHGQVSTVFSKASITVFCVEVLHYNNIVLCFQKWNYQEVCADGRWETGYFPAVA